MDQNEANIHRREDPDAGLLERVAGRDESALAALYDRHGRLVYSLVLGMLGNIDDAEEVTHDVFYRVWEKAGTFDPRRGSGQAWLVTLARRLTIDRTRSKQHKARGRSVPIDAIGESAAAGAAEAVTGSAEAAEVRADIAQLGGL